MGTTCLSREGDREAWKDFFLFWYSLPPGLTSQTNCAAKIYSFSESQLPVPYWSTNILLAECQAQPTSFSGIPTHYLQIIWRCRLRQVLEAACSQYSSSAWRKETALAAVTLGALVKEMIQSWIFKWILTTEIPHVSSPCNKTAVSSYSWMKVREKKKLMSSTKKLRSFSRKALPAFPNASVAATAHLSCQPWPGFSVFQSRALMEGWGYWLPGRLTEELPQAKHFQFRVSRPTALKGLPCRNPTGRTTRASSWRMRRRKERSKDPCISSVQLVAVQCCSWEPGQQTCPRWGRSTKWLSLPPLGKRDCYSRDTETWCHRESRQGRPFLLTRKFSTTDLNVKLWWPEGARAILMGNRDISSRACSPSPAIARAEGRSSIV